MDDHNLISIEPTCLGDTQMAQVTLQLAGTFRTFLVPEDRLAEIADAFNEYIAGRHLNRPA